MFPALNIPGDESSGTTHNVLGRIDLPFGRYWQHDRHNKTVFHNLCKQSG
jgi:hypothetical protein